VATENPSGKRKSVLNKILVYLNWLVILALVLTYLSFHISPTILGYISTIGLAYPIILMINLAFIGFWLIRRWKFALFSIFFILLGFNHFRSCIAWNTPDIAEEGKKEFTVMSFNARLFGVYWSKKHEIRDSIFAMLKSENADVICFQEFYQSEQDPAYDNRGALMKKLGMKHFHERFTHATSGKEYFGVSIFSKYPIIYKGAIPFEGDANNFCIFVDLKVGNDTVRVYDGHLASIRFQTEDYALFDERSQTQDVEDGAMRVAKLLRRGFRKREAQALKLSESVAESPYPVVLCGDFNDTPVSYCYNVLTDDLNDTFVEKGNGLGNTHIGKIPAVLRIDYILTSPKIDVLQYKRISQKLSDHHPIKVKMAI